MKGKSETKVTCVLCGVVATTTVAYLESFSKTVHIPVCGKCVGFQRRAFWKAGLRVVK